MVHPICMDRLQSSLEEPANSNEPFTLDLEECQKKYQEIPYVRESDYSAFYVRPDSSGPEHSRLPAAVSYKIIGQLKDHQSVVEIKSNYGDSVLQSNVVLISGLLPENNPDSRIIRNQEITGGDRCFGGIEKVSIVSPDTLEIERKITTEEFLNLTHDTYQPVKGVFACPTCCIGLVREQYTLGKKSMILTVELNQQLHPNDRAVRQGCFNRLTGKVSEEHVLRINHLRLKDVQRRFLLECPDHRQAPREH